RLAAIWSDVLGLPRIGIEDNFFDLGGDSLRAVRVLSAAHEAELPLSVWMVLQAKNLAELALMVQPATDPVPVQDDLPLLPGHLRQLETGVSGGRTVRLPLTRAVDTELLERAVRTVVRHHEALRLQYLLTDEDPRARLTGLGDEPIVQVLDLSPVAADDRESAVAQALSEANASVDAERGVLLRARLVRFDPASPGELWITLHDLTADRSSWSVVLGDLNSAYRQYGEGRSEVSLAPVATPLHSWAGALAEQARSEEVLDQAGLWLNRPEAAALPTDHQREHHANGAFDTVTATLPSELTDRLLADPHPEHLVLGALARTLARWTGSERVNIDVTRDPRHDRARKDALARTVGRLSYTCPVSLRVAKTGDAADSYRSVSRQLRTLPAPAHGFELLRYLAPDAALAAELAELPEAEVGFAFAPPTELGTDETLAFVPERIAPVPDGARPHLLDVEADVYGGRLYLRWTHSTAVHDRRTVERLVADQLEELASLLRQEPGSSSTGSGNTPGGSPGSSPGGSRSGSPSSTPGGSTGTAAADPLRSLSGGIEDVMARNGIPGAGLALIQDGRTVAVGSFGVLEAGSSEPVAPDTLFAAGSISKHVTTFTVLRLVSQGLLDLDTDINEYLSSWQAPSSPGHPVTARLLLANLAGFAQSPALSDGYRPLDPVPTVLDVLNGRAPARTPALAAAEVPGRVFRQNSLNFSVLQQAMTDITGESYPDLARRLVFEPLAMADSGYAALLPDEAGRHYARGHDAAGRPTPDGYYVNPEAAAGGLWTTAADLASLAAEVRRCYLGAEGALVDRALVQEMLRPQSDRAYGWSTILDTTGEDLEFGHGGQAAGYQAMTWMRVHSGLGLVMLSNAVTGRELVRHLISAVLSGRTRMAGVWQQAIDDAVQRERAAAGPDPRR
ncbi:serine hydrolase, partial [Kitasatospora sp. NPDC058170]|uniref:serine hydrolase domain-containing protein n=1 Tax=Kitasatospora sp. NPDC058170 TaxID=3346364 RepID=UPI0036DA661D